MKVALLTREFPPEVYGGAGVHVEHLSRELAKVVEADVHCFGAERSSPLVRHAYPFPDPSLPAGTTTPLQVMNTDLRMVANLAGYDIVHSHTWYTNFAGHLAKLVYEVPHVVTAHSLEPLRPWKADQLGGGYALSQFCERTAIEEADAVIAVSASMAVDIEAAYPAVDPGRIAVIHNGIDPTEYRPDMDDETLRDLGIDPDRPIVMWIGRVTPQKGVGHLLDMAALLPAEVQLLFLAGASDTPEFGTVMAARAAVLAAERGGLHWIETILPRPEVIQLLSHAAVFVCPSIYEPFGLINLEAMACCVPVVATAVGGIPEIVIDGETGYLVPVVGREVEVGRELAERVRVLLDDPDRARTMGDAGRERVRQQFTWEAIAVRTVDLYSTLLRDSR